MVDRGIPVRLVLYTVAIVYLVVDIFLIGGPLRRAIFRKNPRSAEVVEAAKERGVVARVYFQPILLSQVDWRVEENLWKAGRSPEDVGSAERRILRAAALSELIDLHLLRLKVRFNQEKAEVSDEEIEAEEASFRARFEDEKRFQEALAARGHTVTMVLPPWQNPEDEGRRWREDGVAVENISLPLDVPA